MKVGINLPYQRSDPAPILEMVDIAERGGIDGVFVSDHLWPMGKRSGATLSAFPMAAAIAARTDRIRVGTLVARVGIVDLTAQFTSLQQIAGDRLIAGLGIGDAISRPENEAYGVEWQPRAHRLQLLDEQCARLKDRNIETWLGGKSDPIRALATKHHVTVNEWEPEQPASGTTWGGRVEMDGIAERLQALQKAGVTWAVVLVSGSGKDPVTAIQAAVEAKAIAAR